MCIEKVHSHIRPQLQCDPCQHLKVNSKKSIDLMLVGLSLLLLDSNTPRNAPILIILVDIILLQYRKGYTRHIKISACGPFLQVIQRSNFEYKLRI